MRAERRLTRCRLQSAGCVGGLNGCPHSFHERRKSGCVAKSAACVERQASRLLVRAAPHGSGAVSSQRTPRASKAVLQKLTPCKHSRPPRLVAVARQHRHAAPCTVVSSGGVCDALIAACVEEVRVGRSLVVVTARRCVADIAAPARSSTSPLTGRSATLDDPRIHSAATPRQLTRIDRSTPTRCNRRPAVIVCTTTHSTCACPAPSLPGRGRAVSSLRCDDVAAVRHSSARS